MMDDRQKLKHFLGFCVAYASGYLVTGLDIEELITLLEECLVMAIFLEDIRTEMQIIMAYMKIGDEYCNRSEQTKAIVIYVKCLDMNKSRVALVDMMLCGRIADVYYLSGKYHKAIDYYEKHLRIANEVVDRNAEERAYANLGNIYDVLREYRKALEYHEKSLGIAKEIGDKIGEGESYRNIGKVYQSLGEYHKAIEYHEKSLDIAKVIGDKRGEGKSYGNIGSAYTSLGQYQKAIAYQEKSLSIAKMFVDRQGEGLSYGKLGNAFYLLGDYPKAIDYQEQSLSIGKEIVDRHLELNAYGGLGDAYYSLRVFNKAIEYHEKCLSIAKAISNRNGEGIAHGSIGTVYQSLGSYHKAIKYHEKQLSIAKDIGDRGGEGIAYGDLGDAYYSLREIHKAIKCHEQSLNIAREIDNSEGEGKAYGRLGNAYHFLGESLKSIQYYEKSLSIAREIADTKEEARCYENLGNAYFSLGGYRKAIEYHEKTLDIDNEIGNRHGEATSYLNIGNAYQSLGEYHKAIEYLLKSLSIAKEIDDRRGEGQSYLNLGNVYYLLGEYKKTIENYENCLSIAKEIADRHAEGIAYGNLGNVYILGKYYKAVEYYEKGLSIAKEIADRHGEGSLYGNLGLAYSSLGEYHKAIEHYEKSLTIQKEIADRRGEGYTYGGLGSAYCSLGEYHTAIDYYEKHLSIAKEIANKRGEAAANYFIANTYLKIPTLHLRKAKEHLTKSIKCYEECFDDLKDKYEFKISIVDTFSRAYKMLSKVFIESGQRGKALLTCERGRARALGDLLSLKYVIDKETTSEKKPLKLADVMTIASACDGCILFCDIHQNKLAAHFWVVDSQHHAIFFYDEMGQIKDLRNIVENLSEEDQQELSKQGYFQHLVDQSYIDIVREGMQCEDRSFGELQSQEQELAISGLFSDSREAAVSVFQALTRCVYDEEEEDKSLEMLYARLISPVQSHLVEEEIVIIPDGPLFMIPFAALQDPATGKYLSETKRIRLAPSLTTLKLLQESSEDHHCKSGALIVGNPATGRVVYQGREKQFTSLPGAEEEARKIGDLLGVEPLIGEQATKQAILGKLRDGVSVIHFAAHGSEENGQILLAPSVPSTTNNIPEEKDYILTMKEAQEIGVRAQLVVLSCCHSGRGEIKSEGVVGMARAFLAAGARAVVASLWAIEDEAAKMFMLMFYSHLKTGESATRSLQHAMKEMRETENYKKPKYWAAFFLIGDDVTISV